jgi:hypothetical protein
VKRLALVFAGALALALPAAAAGPPTIAADPSIVGFGTQLVLSGVVPGAGAGETVEIEAKECTGTFFRLVGTTETTGGGTWRHQAFAAANTTFRARWKNTVSPTVDIQQRIFVSLARRSRTVVAAMVFTAHQRMIGRTVRLERLSPGGWVLLRKAKLRRLAGPQTEARFLVSRKGMRLRAVVDQANARPCYAAGVSLIIRS